MHQPNGVIAERALLSTRRPAQRGQKRIVQTVRDTHPPLPGFAASSRSPRSPFLHLTMPKNIDPDDSPPDAIKQSNVMRQIARSTARFTEVTAVPGAGKTTAATARVQHLLQKHPGARIQVLSATNATVFNFRQRLEELEIEAGAGLVAGSSGPGPTVAVSTVHALFFALIRRHHLALGFLHSPSVMDVGTKTKILRSIHEPKGGAGQKGRARAAASKLERSRLAARSTPAQAYQDHKRAKNLIDFDDMLRLGRQLLDRLTAKQLGIDHLIVDEWQDCTTIQSQLIAGLAQRVQTTVVLGDRLQAVYGFMGGRYTPLRLALADRGMVLGDDEVKERTLNWSYRLTAETAALAMAVAQPLGAPVIEADRDGKKPVLLEAEDTHALAQLVAEQVQKLLDRGVVPSRIALLGRVRSVLHPVAQELAGRTVATTLTGSGSGNYYQAVLDVLWLAERFEELRDHGLGVEPGASGRAVTLSAELQAEMRERLGLDDLDGLLAAAQPDGGADEEHDEDAAPVDVAPRPLPERWAQFVKDFLSIHGATSLEGAYRACVRIYLCLHGGINAHKPLRNAVNRWDTRTRGFACAAEMAAHVEKMARATAITCSTIHAAKGMEWDYVFVLGVTQGVLPDRRAKAADQLDEERRVLFVAITRARKRVWLAHSPIKVSGVRREYRKLSAFLEPSEVLKTLRDASMRKAWPTRTGALP
ncbi:hypothetical protein DBA29_27005 [Xenophilus aerolatus]|nr:hypothetical protein [Xenophilus aerolatus]